LKIYIDESGIFSANNNLTRIDKAWGTVGAITIPHKNIKKASAALCVLKSKLKIPVSLEIKNEFRPEPSSEYFAEFLTELLKLDCTFHAMTVNRTSLNDDATRMHMKAQIDGRANYIKKIESELNQEEFEEYVNEFEVTKELINSSSIQEYNQVVIQSYLISFMLDKTITYYLRNNPRELSRFEWVFDLKNSAPARFELLYSKFMPETVESHYYSEPRGIPYIPEAIKYFYRNYGAEEVGLGMPLEEIERRKRLFNVDHSTVAGCSMPILFGKILNNYSVFLDSNKSDGLQIADLVVSAVNRFLKGNVDDVVKTSKLLGPLFVNSPRIDVPAIPHVNFGESSESIKNINFDNLELLNFEARELYTKVFRSGFTKNIRKLLERQSNGN